MKKFVKHLVITIACIMTVVMLGVSAPESWIAMAEAAQTESAPQAREPVHGHEHELREAANIGEPQEESEAIILGEDVSQRSESTKGWFMDDGTVTVHSYSEPVHYLSGSGKFEEIDNSFRIAEDSLGNVTYVNDTNLFETRFSGDPENGLFSIVKDDYSLEFMLDGSIDTAGELNRISKDAMAEPVTELYNGAGTIKNYKDKKLTEPDIVFADKSEMRHKSILPGIDLTYEVTAGRVKENIIINFKQDSYTYRFDITVKGLALIMEDDGSIKAVDVGKQSITVFRIPAPFMYDALGVRSDNVHYSLKGGKDGYNYVLTIAADIDWINSEERRFPITIDPVVYEETNPSASYSYATVSANGAKTTTGTKIYSGNQAPTYTSGYSEGYISFRIPPKGGAYYTLLSGSLNYYKVNTMGFAIINYDSNVYAFKPDTTIGQLTWYNKPAVSTGTLVSNRTHTADGFAGWLEDPLGSSLSYISENGRIMFGFMAENNSLTSKRYIGISVNESGYNPYLKLRYKRASGIESGEANEQFGSGAISHNVSVISRYMTTVIDYISVNSNLMPLKVQGVHTPDMSSLLSDFGITSNFYGTNIKLNCQQYIKEMDVNGDSVSEVLLLDGSGRVHMFFYSKTHYICSDCGQMLEKSGSNYYLFDDTGFRHTEFVSNRLSRVNSKDGQNMRVEYNSDGSIYTVRNYISGTSPGGSSTTPGQYISFAYSGGKLSSMKSNYNGTATLSYSGNNLMYVYNNGDSYPSASLTYNNGSIATSKDYTGEGYSFTYWGYNGYPVMVDKATPIGSNYVGIVFTDSGFKRSVLHDVGTSLVSIYIKDLYITVNGEISSIYSHYNEVQGNEHENNTIIIPKFSYSGPSEGTPAGEFISTGGTFTEDLDSINNGSFQTLSGSVPSDWNCSSGVGYISEFIAYTSFYNYLVSIPKNGFISQQYITVDSCEYVTFYARGGCADCEVTVSVNGINKRLKLNTTGGYYVYDREGSALSGTLSFTNSCTMCTSAGKIYIDNVSASEAMTTKIYSKTTSVDGKAVKYINNIDEISKAESKYSTYIMPSSGSKGNVIQSSSSYTMNPSGSKSNYETTNYRYDRAPSAHKVIEVTVSGGTGSVTTTYNYNFAGLVSKVNKTYSDTSPVQYTTETYEYETYGLVTKSIDASGVRTYYTYDTYGSNNLRSKTICNSDTDYDNTLHNTSSHYNDYSELYSYDSYGRFEYMTNGASTNRIYTTNPLYNESYSGDNNTVSFNKAAGKVNSVSVNNTQQTYVTYDYYSGLPTNYTYYPGGSNQTVDVEYNGYKLPTSKIAKTGGVVTDTYSFVYNTDKTLNYETWNGTTYDYNYSKTNPLVIIYGNGYAGTMDYKYNATTGVLTEASYKLSENGAVTLGSVGNVYNNYWQLTNTNGTYHKSVYSGYDSMGRPLVYALSNSSGSEMIRQTHAFKTASVGGVNSQTGMLSGVTDNRDSTYNQSMTYYTNGMLKTHSQKSGTIAYEYDSFGRLSKETPSGGTAVSYLYSGNNLYQVTAGSQTELYGYANGYTDNLLASHMKNNVTKYFTYDNMGNPTRYMAASASANPNMVWSQGRKLASGSLNGNSFSYRYNAEGTRYEKTVNGVTTRYYLEGDNIIAESKTGGGVQYYFYDATGISGMSVISGSSRTNYFFKKNVLGDIIAIYNDSGSVVGSYSYDAWGNVTIGTNTNGIATANPFRYRGYYYDNETGFYYLQSRYYDPVIRRFISQDTPSVVGQLISVPGQMNLYAYCGNNPVMYTDPSGELIITALMIAFAIIGALVAGAYAYDTAKSSGASGWELAGWTVLGAIGGALIGGFIGWALPYLIGGFGAGGTVTSIGAIFGKAIALKAIADVSITSIVVVAGAAAATAAGTIVLSSKGMPGDHKRANEQVNQLGKKHGLDNDTLERVHELIHGQNYSYKELEEIIKEFIKKITYL